VQAVQAGAEFYKSYNPGCFGLAFQESANKFVDILYRHPNMLDIFLSGSLFVVNAGKHIPGDHQEMFESVAIISEAVLGTSCGVLYWLVVLAFSSTTKKNTLFRVSNIQFLKQFQGRCKRRIL